MIDPNSHRIITAESGLEWNVALVLLARRDVIELREQPEAVRFIEADGVRQTHVFDFLAIMSGGSRIAIAVKPERKATKLRQSFPLLASQVPEAFATGAVLITDRNIDLIAIHNAKLLLQMRARINHNSDQAAWAVIRHLIGATTIGTLVEAIGTGADAFGSIVRFISEGRLGLKRREKIDYGSIVEARS